MMSTLIVKITKANDNLSSTSSSNSSSSNSPSNSSPSSPNLSKTQVHSQITRFHARSIPTNITIHQYLARILKYAPCNNAVLMAILVYMDRLANSKNPFVVNSYNVHRFLIVGVMVATKFFSDVFYTNSHYAKVGGISTVELNQLELEFLFMMNFDLIIQPHEFDKYGNQLLNHYLAEMRIQESLQTRLQITIPSPELFGANGTMPISPITAGAPRQLASSSVACSSNFYSPVPSPSQSQNFPQHISSSESEVHPPRTYSQLQYRRGSLSHASSSSQSNSSSQNQSYSSNSPGRTYPTQPHLHSSSISQPQSQMILPSNHLTRSPSGTQVLHLPSYNSPSPNYPQSYSNPASRQSSASSPSAYNLQPGQPFPLRTSSNPELSQPLPIPLPNYPNNFNEYRSPSNSSHVSYSSSVSPSTTVAQSQQAYQQSKFSNNKTSPSLSLPSIQSLTNPQPSHQHLSVPGSFPSQPSSRPLPPAPLTHPQSQQTYTSVAYPTSSVASNYPIALPYNENYSTVTTVNNSYPTPVPAPVSKDAGGRIGQNAHAGRRASLGNIGVVGGNGKENGNARKYYC